MKYVHFLTCCLFAILFGIACACAESILPEWTELVEEYPSYSEISMTEPVAKRTTAENELVYHYTDITKDQYRQFGVLLGERGYTVETSNQTTDAIQANLVKGENRFSIVYYPAAEEMDVVYPADAAIATIDYATSLNGYSEFFMGDTLYLPGMGEICITKVNWNNSTYRWTYCLKLPGEMISAHEAARSTKNLSESIAGYLVLEGTFTNATHEELNGMSLKKMQKQFGYSVYVSYINAYDSYPCVDGYMGSLGIDAENKVQYLYQNCDTNITKEIPLFKPMDQASLGLAFNLSENVTTSSDGLVVLVIEGDEGRYFMRLRENGVNCQ